MKTDTLKVKEILEKEKCTCVILGKDIYITENRRGVAPLLDFYEKGMDFSSCCAADKVVGKAAAMLYVLLNISEVYTFVISREAQKVFEKNGISYFADTVADKIKNRTETGYCPMEEAVTGIDNPYDAIFAIKEKLKELTGKSQ